jgi:hypothetical protein
LSEQLSRFLNNSLFQINPIKSNSNQSFEPNHPNTNDEGNQNNNIGEHQTIPEEEENNNSESNDSVIIDMISIHPSEKPLNMTGKLIDFQNFNHAISHLSQFMDEASAYLPKAFIPNLNLDHFKSMIEYVEVVSTRILKEMKGINSWKSFIIEIWTNNELLHKKVIETQENANAMFQLKNKCFWKSSLNNFEDINSTIPKATSSENFISPTASMQEGLSTDQSPMNNKDNNGAPPTKSSEPPSDPDDDNSSSDGSDSSGDAFKDFLKYFKNKSVAKPSKRKKDKTEDEKYRTLVRNLLKSTKNFDICTFNIHPDPTTRHDAFAFGLQISGTSYLQAARHATFWTLILQS